MFAYKYIPHMATLAFILIALSLFIYLIKERIKEKEEEKNFQKQLEYSVNPTDDSGLIKEGSFIDEKLKILPNQLIKAEIIKEGTPIESIQRKGLLYGGILFTGSVLFSGSMLVGFVPVAIAYGGLRVYSMMKINKKKATIEEQIPGFVSTFKANIQANQHAQNAMINAIDNTASPLYDELSYSKAIMEAGDFRPGIIALRRDTSNDTLRQMASCIELASSSGSNIEDQIDIIEDIIKDKQLIERKKKLGINENRPLFYIAGLFVPLSFVGSYVMSDMHRDYWFTTPASWLILVGVGIVSAISMYATWKVIQKVDIG